VNINRVSDSLLNEQKKLSEKFRKAVKIKTEAVSLDFLLAYFHYLYVSNSGKDSVAQGIREQFIPAINSITDIDKMLFGFDDRIEELAQYFILPTKFFAINSEKKLTQCFDTTVSTFKEMARDYVLSKVLINALNNHVPVSKEMFELYNTICKTKEYKKTVYNTQKNQQFYQADNDKVNGNLLFSFEEQKTKSIDDLFKSYKGNVILVDFWSSWCIPCLKEVPYIEEMEKNYAGKGIIFLSISFDKEGVSWKNAVRSHNMNARNAYRLFNGGKSEFINKYHIYTIPRYILINKEGNIIDDDAPSPSDPKLKELIDKYLK
jgi:thiol-disulfide isomerase/thioredoxin